MLGRILPTCLLMLALSTSSALAQPAGAADRSAARQLGQEGVALYQKGEYDSALDRLSRAEALVPAPSLSLWAARSLVKLGRLVEANERYLAATRVNVEEQGLDAARLEVQKKAQADAAKERTELLPRIPKLTVKLKPVGAVAQVTIDGRELPAALIGVPHPIDPGKHRVELGGEAQEVILTEGEAKEVELNAPAVDATPPPMPANVAPKPATTPPADASPRAGSPPVDAGSESSALPAYLALGMGGAGFIFGGVTGFIALQKKSDLDDNCPDKSCGPEFHADVDSYDSMKLLSTIGLAVGVVGVASGVVLLISRSRESEVHARVGLGSVGVGGRF
ncbi:MAG: hypothetical protein H6718_24130 [Polyangiaceae bacterium]|nr:hypothetical protein [Polyangiaceae bacterium]